MAYLLSRSVAASVKTKDYAISRIAVDMDIHGYIHVWISDVGVLDEDLAEYSDCQFCDCCLTGVSSILVSFCLTWKTERHC